MGNGKHSLTGIESARKARSDDMTARVSDAVEALMAEGAPVSFYTVAGRAQVARSTLYRRPDLRAVVEAAREAASVEPMRVEEQERLAREVWLLRRKVDELSTLLPAMSYRCVTI